jgi:hypothetical protein
MERDREFVSIRWVVAGILIGIVGGLWLNHAGGARIAAVWCGGAGRRPVYPPAADGGRAVGRGVAHYGGGGAGHALLWDGSASSRSSTTRRPQCWQQALGLVIVNLVDPGVGAAIARSADRPERDSGTRAADFCRPAAQPHPREPYRRVGAHGHAPDYQFQPDCGRCAEHHGRPRASDQGLRQRSVGTLDGHRALGAVSAACGGRVAVGADDWSSGLGGVRAAGEVYGRGAGRAGNSRADCAAAAGVGVGGRTAVAVPARHLECDADRA